LTEKWASRQRASIRARGAGTALTTSREGEKSQGRMSPERPLSYAESIDGVPPARGVPGGAAASEPVPLLVERTRGALWTLLALMAAFLVVEADAKQPAAAWLLKGAHVVLVVGGLLLLRGVVASRIAFAVAFVTVVGSCVLIAAGDVLMQQGDAVPLVTAVASIAAAALLPWGVLAQVFCALALGGAAWALLAGTPASQTGFSVAVLWVALTISVYVARELERHRRIGHDAEQARSRSLAKLEEVNRLKTDFVAMVSHELRTPLNVIAGYAEMLEDPECAERALALNRIRAANVELLDLVDATLSVERLESGRDVPSIEAVSVNALFAEIGEELDSLASRANLRIRWAAADEITLRSDRRKLKTILKNLVGNAIKFTRTGEIDVSGRCDGTAVVLAVRDTGIGIPRDQLPRVFERFGQVDGSAERGPGGVGLGLHIVRKFCEQLGGRIEVESEVGRGTTFTVTLPLAGPPANSSIPPAPAPLPT
jgi:signal transduction histidine kinase